MIRFRVSLKAQRELDAIFAYWATQASLEVADRLLDEIERHFDLLAGHPEIGHNCDQFAPGVRCFPAGKYLIYYRRNRKRLEILHIFHGARDQAHAWKPKQRYSTDAATSA